MRFLEISIKDLGMKLFKELMRSNSTVHENTEEFYL